MRIQMLSYMHINKDCNTPRLYVLCTIVYQARSCNNYIYIYIYIGLHIQYTGVFLMSQVV